MARNNKKGKLDKVSVTILSAFLLMTGTHLGCRYDVGAAVDSMFKKVSAETVAATPAVQDPIAVAPVSVPSALEEAQNAAQPTIARNPFLVPVAARPAPVVVRPSSSAPSYSASAPAAVSAPVPAAPKPHVKGIIKSGGKSVAIIEYKGRSATYAPGASIGDGYRVNGIQGKSVSINGNSVNLGGRR